MTCSSTTCLVQKDISETVDHVALVPPLVNFWIPIAGCGPRSSLPVAPGSHLIPESEILRTRAGSVVHSRPYRVNSAHLVHGFAVNDQADTTRVALEFRLIPAVSPGRSTRAP